MFIVDSYGLAVLFSILTMICWGSWANTQKISESNWKFELFYWDYVIGICVLSLIMGLTLGSTGEVGVSFIENLSQADGAMILSALLGGVIFNAANILVGASIAIAGMAVAFPVGIGLALVLGVIVNYLDHPIGNEKLLILGVGFVVLAILLNSYAYKKMRGGLTVSAKGLLLAITGGILMGFFYKYVANAMFPDFALPVPGKLSPYSAVFVFSIGLFISNLVFNSLLMRFPFQGSPVSFGQYFRGRVVDHLPGLAGGIIWCLGMSLSILASDKAGPAISYGLGQGATLVAALWGIFIWGEFKKAPKGTNLILGLMLLFFATGLSILVIAR